MLENIFKRRSVRKFTSEPIDDETVKSLLEAAMAAPSSNNKRPWRFVVVRERRTLDRLADMHPYGKMLSQATLAIVVCGDVEKSPTAWFLDCSAATENILLAAAEMDLGAVWLGVYLRKKRETGTREILNIPENIGVLSIIAIGRPGEEKPPRTQYEESNVFYERWS